MEEKKAPTVERHELGFIGRMEADGTRYEVLVIPFKSYLGLGFISQSDAYLVVDGGEKTAYVFKSPPVWDYVWEKLIRGYKQGFGETDAKNTAALIAYVMQAVKDYKDLIVEPTETGPWITTLEKDDEEEEPEPEEEDEGEVQHPGSGGPAPFRLEDEDEENESKSEDEKAY